MLKTKSLKACGCAMKTLQCEYQEMLPEIKRIPTKDTLTATQFGFSELLFINPSFFNVQSCSAGRTEVSGIMGFKMAFKASDLVQLKINDCRASKPLLNRRSWRLV